MFGHLLSKKDPGLQDKSDNSAYVKELQTKLEQQEKFIQAIAKVGLAAKQGDMNARISDWDKYGDYREIAVNLNHAFDLTDAFLREAAASLEAAKDRRYYRKFLQTGMLGDFGAAVGHMNASTNAMVRQEQDAQKEKQALFEDFNKQVTQVNGAVSQSIANLTQTSNILGEQAASTQRLAVAVAQAATNANANVQSVAAAVEQLSGSVSEVARQVVVSLEETTQASDQAIDAKGKIVSLSEASKAISDVVTLINDIAEQTNLLALNATIEAARAGDAGKGFAVVASEVKTLASQTAGATSEISGQVTRIQSETSGSVQSVEHVATAIEALNKSVSMIAAATEEQTASTQEISRNIQQAASEADIVSQEIEEVSTTATKTRDSAAILMQVSSDIQKEIENLTALLASRSADL